MRVVACRALEGGRGRLRGEEARTLTQTVRVRHNVDAAGPVEERVLVAQRLRRQIAELVLPLAQHRDRSVHVALLADVEAPREGEPSGVDDRPVVAAVTWRLRDSLLDVLGAGTMAALAPDAR